MTAEAAQRFESLDRQAQKILSVFSSHGYEMIAPATLQPAEVFIDVIGEALRARTYVFTDPDGEELCLRPDLTVPVCRLHIERHAKSDVRARYSYNGSAFRFQPGGGTNYHPNEFRQAGIENFAASDREKAETEIVSHTLEALTASGLKDYRLRLGDLGLFRALLNSLDIPKRWRRRLLHCFGHREVFSRELAQLAAGPGDALKGLPMDLIGKIDPEDPRGTERLVDAYLNDNGIEMIGVRTLSEIADRLTAAALDAKAPPLSPAHANAIQSYMEITAPSRAAGARLKDLMRERGIDISDALDIFKRRLSLLDDAGVDVAKSEFSADFGRNLDYYTGFVFEVEAPLLGRDSPVAGGGRYDKLLKASGAAFDVPAVGAAIHTQRLLDALAGDATAEDA